MICTAWMWSCSLLLTPTGPKHLPRAALQLGAGVSWTVDTSYQWAGLAGTYRGYGPSIQPQVRALDQQSNRLSNGAIGGGVERSRKSTLC